MAKANRPDHAYSFLLLTRQQHHSLSTVDRNAISVSRNTFGDIDNDEKLTTTTTATTHTDTHKMKCRHHRVQPVSFLYTRIRQNLIRPINTKNNYFRAHISNRKIDNC